MTPVYSVYMWEREQNSSMGINCAPLVADLLYTDTKETDFMDSLNNDNQTDVIEAFNST